MEVRRFGIEKELSGVRLCLVVETDVEIKFDIPVHREVVKGLNKEEEEKLEGKKDFSKLYLIAEGIDSIELAKRAHAEILSILEAVEHEEDVKEAEISDVMEYLKMCSIDYHKRQGGKNERDV